MLLAWFVSSPRHSGVNIPSRRLPFRDSRLPVKVALEAFSPFFPLDAEDSGLPVTILRYRVSNRSARNAAVSIAFAIDNPVGVERRNVTRRPGGEQRVNEYRKGNGFEGLVMRNPALSENDPQSGTFALCMLNTGEGKVTYLRGWPSAKCWARCERTRTS